MAHKIDSIGDAIAQSHRLVADAIGRNLLMKNGEFCRECNGECHAGDVTFALNT